MANHLQTNLDFNVALNIFFSAVYGKTSLNLTLLHKQKQKALQQVVISPPALAPSVVQIV